MNIVVEKLVEAAEKQGREHSISGGRFVSENVALEVDPDCMADSPKEFRLSWPHTTDFSSDLTFSMYLLIFTIGKDYDSDGLMARIGQGIQRGNRFSEDRGDWKVSSFITDGRCHLDVTRK